MKHCFLLNIAMYRRLTCPIRHYDLKPGIWTACNAYCRTSTSKMSASKRIHSAAQGSSGALNRSVMMGTLQCLPHVIQDMGGCTCLSLVQLHPLKSLESAHQLTGVLKRVRALRQQGQHFSISQAQIASTLLLQLGIIYRHVWYSCTHCLQHWL